MTRRIAQLRSLVNATTQLPIASPTGTATTKGMGLLVSPMTGRELRAQLRAQQHRNSPPQHRNSAPEKVASVAVSEDSRRMCKQCANLSNSGQCLAAWRGEAKAWPWFAPQNYHPVADLPQFCPSLRPLPADADQRAGAERWPSLAGSTVKPSAMPRRLP